MDKLGYHADGKLDFFFSLTSAIALHVWSVFQREWVQISVGNDYTDFFRGISHHLQVNAETMPHIKYFPHSTAPIHFEIPFTRSTTHGSIAS